MYTYIYIYIYIYIYGSVYFVLYPRRARSTKGSEIMKMSCLVVKKAPAATSRPKKKLLFRIDILAKTKAPAANSRPKKISLKSRLTFLAKNKAPAACARPKKKSKLNKQFPYEHKTDHGRKKNAEGWSRSYTARTWGMEWL